MEWIEGGDGGGYLQFSENGEVMVGALDDKVDEHAEGDGAAPRLDLLRRLLHEVGWRRGSRVIY